MKRLALLGLMLCVACEETQVLCECAIAGTTVVVPDNLSATAVRISGVGCDHADLKCGDQHVVPESGLCTSGEYFIPPADDGVCHIEVDLDGHGTFTRDVRFEDSDGCCEGVYPVSGDWLVNVEVQ
ncbi:MAG: hypothetical protein ACAI38_22950 [Myxococcota bacterium]|nr:hypothetical protein [Myxococcota bacterium]